MLETYVLIKVSVFYCLSVLWYFVSAVAKYDHDYPNKYDQIIW